MSETNAIKPLYEIEWTIGQRLAACRRYLTVHPIPMLGERKATADSPQTFKFTSWNDVAEVVGAALADHGIVPHVTVLDWQATDSQTRGGKPTKSWIVKIQLTLASAEAQVSEGAGELTDRLVSEWVGGSDDPDTSTGLSKATTFCVRDALMKSHLLLAGDDSDQQQVSENGSAASFASGVAGGIVCPKCQVGKVVQKQGKNGPWIGCSNWKPNDKGCDWKQWGTTIQDWLDKTQEQERQREPDPEAPFVADQDGTPRAQTRGEVEAATSGPVHSPAVAKIMALWSERDDAGRLVRPREQAREVILQNGGMSALKMPTEPDGQWLLRPSALEALKLPVLAKIQGVLEGIVVTAGLPLSPAVAFDRAVTGDHD
jgi:hypothetical protein